MLKAIRKKRAYEDIVKQIRHLIEREKLKRGDQLPTERELSNVFRVSRNTVREAIFSLEAMNLVTRRQGGGTYVIASSEETLVQPLANALFHEKDDIIDIFALRKIIEPEVAGLAAENATPEELDEMEEILKEQGEEIRKGDSSVRTDSQFHQFLVRTSKNRALQRLVLAIIDLLTETRERYLQTNERDRKSLQGHRQILRALRNHNSHAARRAMRTHLEEVEDILFKKKERKRSKVTNSFA
jgi:GntR family transcriptional regulator, transcriptional repressor for pyruvate dehydrogenase complex